MPEAEKNKPTTYFVNDEKQETQAKELAVGTILTNAGFEPPSDYELEDDENHKAYSDPTEVIHVHEGQKFTATYTGTTPTSHLG